MYMHVYGAAGVECKPTTGRLKWLRANGAKRARRVTAQGQKDRQNVYVVLHGLYVVYVVLACI